MSYSYEDMLVTTRKLYNWMNTKSKRSAERMMVQIMQALGLKKSQPITIFHFATFLGTNEDEAFRSLNDAQQRPWPPPKTSKKDNTKKNKNKKR